MVRMVVGVFARHREPPMHDALSTRVQPKHVPETGAAQNWFGFCADPLHWQQSFGLGVGVRDGVVLGVGVSLKTIEPVLVAVTGRPSSH